MEKIISEYGSVLLSGGAAALLLKLFVGTLGPGGTLAEIAIRFVQGIAG